jgi:hypothetical protein
MKKPVGTSANDLKESHKKASQKAKISKGSNNPHMKQIGSKASSCKGHKSADK